MIDLTKVETVLEKATYQVPVFEVTNNGLAQIGVETIKFVKGNKEDETVFRQAGFTTETLISACIQYLNENNVGELSSRETSLAITNFEQGLMWLQRRAANRKARGVQGTYQK
jgi:hypothetical protein